MFGLLNFLKPESGKAKARALLLSGRKITSHEANRVIGWKFATRMSEAIRELREEGYKVNKTTYNKRFRIYQLEGEK